MTDLPVQRSHRAISFGDCTDTRDLSIRVKGTFAEGRKPMKRDWAREREDSGRWPLVIGGKLQEAQRHVSCVLRHERQAEGRRETGKSEKGGED